jgi:hypothetical protein
VITTLENGSYAAVFNVALDVTSGREVQVLYFTSDGAAVDGGDYTGVSARWCSPRARGR